MWRCWLHQERGNCWTTRKRRNQNHHHLQRVQSQNCFFRSHPTMGSRFCHFHRMDSAHQSQRPQLSCFLFLPRAFVQGRWVCAFLGTNWNCWTSERRKRSLRSAKPSEQRSSKRSHSRSWKDSFWVSRKCRGSCFKGAVERVSREQKEIHHCVETGNHKSEIRCAVKLNKHMDPGTRYHRIGSCTFDSWGSPHHWNWTRAGSDCWRALDKFNTNSPNSYPSKYYNSCSYLTFDPHTLIESNNNKDRVPKWGNQNRKCQCHWTRPKGDLGQDYLVCQKTIKWVLINTNTNYYQSIAFGICRTGVLWHCRFYCHLSCWQSCLRVWIQSFSFAPRKPRILRKVHIPQRILVIPWNYFESHSTSNSPFSIINIFIDFAVTSWTA